MHTLTRLALSSSTALLVLVPLATPAVADTAPGTVIAADTTPEPPAPVTALAVSQVVGIDADLVNGLTITGTRGNRVTLTARGERTRTAKTHASTVRFRGLTAGKSYTVRIDGTLVGTGTPVGPVGPAVGLTVATTTAPDEVLLRWNQRPTRGQGPVISYAVLATPVTAIGRSTATTAVVTGVTTDRVATLVVDPAVRYTFTVTPRNSAGTGRATTATMSRTLREMTGTTDVPSTPAAPPLPIPAPAPAPVPTPAPAGPSTKTIYVCPDTFTESPQGACEKTTPYTFTTIAYTFHTETTGPAPILDSYETAVAACPGGYNFEDYGWVKYCRKYGTAPTRTVKDATPDGYTDTGTTWTTKDTPPAGYADNGTTWVTTTAKIAKVIPA
jgi:hypothetical protein